MLVAAKYFFQTKPLSRQIFVTTNINLSRQTRACRDKKKPFVATELCKYQFCCDKDFVATNILLSRQKFCLDKHIFCLDKRRVCRDKNDTPMILYSTLAQTVAYRSLPTVIIKTTTKGGLALAFPTRVVW